MESWLIVLPAYNEGENIAGVISGIRSAGNTANILVVDDGSKDGTSGIARKLGVMVISHPYNLGYGAALQTGFRFAVKREYKYVVTMDSDGQHDPMSITNLFTAIIKEGADVVIGSRFLKSGYRMGLARRIGSWLFARVAGLYTGYMFTDPTSGFQLLNRDAFTYLSSEEGYPLDYPDVNIIMLLHKRRFKVVECPVTMSKGDGYSMHSGIRPLIYVIRMFLAILIVLLRKED